jgi:hypothetical protein
MFMEPSSNEITPQTPFHTSTDRVRKYFQQLKYYDSSSPTPSGKKHLPANVKSNAKPGSDLYEEKEEQLPGVNEYEVAEDALRATEPPSERGEQQDEQLPPVSPSKVADDALTATEPLSEGGEQQDEQLPPVSPSKVADDALTATEPLSEGGEQQDEQLPPVNPIKVGDDALTATEPPSMGEDQPVEELQLPDGVYLTERVVESRRTSGKLWLKIKWKGVKTPSWELAEYMRNELGEEDYKELLETKPRKRRKKASKW